MIYEFRTYTLKPRSLAEVEKRFGEAYEYRKKYSPLAAFWHTEVGPLNEIIHVWATRTSPSAPASAPRRPRTAQLAAQDRASSSWTSTSEIVMPFPFLPDITPGTDGPDLRDPPLQPGGGLAARTS